MFVDTFYSISVSQQDDSFTCGLHVEKKHASFYEYKNNRGKKSIDLQQWKVCNFGNIRQFNSFLRKHKIENFFKEDLCKLHQKVSSSTFPHLDKNYLLNTMGINDILA